MKKAHGLRLAIAMMVIFTLFFPGVSARAQNGPAEVYSGGLRERVELTLRADGAPLPGGTSQLSIDAIPLIDVPDLEIHWYIPEGVQLLGYECRHVLQCNCASDGQLRAHAQFSNDWHL